MAGNGTGAFCGDGGPATSACLWSPWAVATDAAGALFIGEVMNHRVRQVDTLGTSLTVAGSGSGGFCGDNGPATSACISSAEGVAVSAAGSLFIVDR